jgi:hypothetical protein
MNEESLNVFEWHIVETVGPESFSTPQHPLHMGPFASEEECRAPLASLKLIPRFSRGGLKILKRYKRRQKRIRVKLTVQVCRPAAREESWPACTVDISLLGCRLIGLPEKLHLGEFVEICCNQRRSVFRVVWVGTPDTKTEAQIGVECLNPENNIWDLDLSGAGEEPLLQEIAVARAVQSNLLPQDQPLLQTLDYSGNCIQARSVGGDYYDFLDLGEGQVGFVLADVSGKGVSAALLMANLQGSLHSHAGKLDAQNLPRLLTRVNRHLYKHTESGRYATFFFGCYSDDTRSLQYVNCGHNPPLLLRHAGAVERLTPTATVLGLFKDWECSVGETRLETGDVLTIFTDGVTETRGSTGEEFGEDRLLGALNASRHLEAASILRHVEQAIGKFRSGVQPEDDLTLVVARAQ